MQYFQKLGFRFTPAKEFRIPELFLTEGTKVTKVMKRGYVLAFILV
jgi:hypothetical protein